MGAHVHTYIYFDMMKISEKMNKSDIYKGLRNYVLFFIQEFLL